MRAGWEAGGGGWFPGGVGSCGTPARDFGDLSRLQRPVSSCLFRDAEGWQSWGTLCTGKSRLYWGLDCFSSEERMVFNEHKAHDIMLLQITTIHS